MRRKHKHDFSEKRRKQASKQASKQSAKPPTFDRGEASQSICQQVALGCWCELDLVQHGLEGLLSLDVEKILAAFQILQRDVEYVVVEGTGRWLAPIQSDYFVSDLAAAMKLPVLVVAQNRLGCLNHAALTVRKVAAYELRCVSLAA